jgi:hypothetical protein
MVTVQHQEKLLQLLLSVYREHLHALRTSAALNQTSYITISSIHDISATGDSYAVQSPLKEEQTIQRCGCSLLQQQS